MFEQESVLSCSTRREFSPVRSGENSPDRDSSFLFEQKRILSCPGRREFTLLFEQKRSTSCSNGRVLSSSNRRKISLVRTREILNVFDFSHFVFWCFIELQASYRAQTLSVDRSQCPGKKIKCMLGARAPKKLRKTCKTNFFVNCFRQFFVNSLRVLRFI